MAVACAAHRGTPVDPAAPNAEAALAGVLARDRGLACDADDVAWIDGATGVHGAITGGAHALVRARRPGEPSDLYLVDVRLSPEGVVLDVGDAYDVTDTIAVDESRPAVRGHLAAYATSADGVFTGVHVLDLDGHPASAYGDFTRVQRAQMALTNLQQTGRTTGVSLATYALDPVAHAVRVAWRDDGNLDVAADERAIEIDPRAVRVVVGESFVRVVPDERARPGNVVTWAVDRVRAMPWFGDDRMQMLKAVAFTLLDKINAHLSHGTTAQDVAEELGLPSAPAGPTTFADPEVGWPPPPMKVPVSPALPGEGRWIPLDKDPFITPTAAGSAPAFVTSFVRPDVHRQDVRVYVTLWDPRQIALHMEAGTVEPIGADGEHGPGLVPRTPEVMSHFVAAFNGGFQAQHGEYGMSANGIEYLPPKPYAASVVELRDGSNGFGAWPNSGAVPDDIVAFRQNLTALVQDGRFNPWGRNWWGGTPPGWPDQIHSARSAICLTAENFAGYFYSASISAEDLAQAMLDARCVFGIHLDMNPGHAGFEFYDVAPGPIAPLGRPMQGDWEAEGKVPDMPGWTFRSRRMIRGMGHMLFPRYIQREARDFFYLTSRAILPGGPLPSSASAPVAPAPEPSAAQAMPGAPAPAGDDGASPWRTRGLPQHGFPYAIALATSETGGHALRVLRADPRTMRPGDAHDAAPVVLALSAPDRPEPGTPSLWWSASVFSVGPEAPAKDAVRLASGVSPRSPSASAARAAVGVQDEDGMLVWVELAPADRPDARTAAAMDGVLESLGCTARMLLREARALPGGTLDAAGDPLAGTPAPLPTAWLVRAQAPGARSIFTDTPIVPSTVWQPLQAKRVRYFYKPPPAPSASTAAAATPAPTAVRVQSPR